MDYAALNTIILKEINALDELLRLLEEQHDLLISNDVFKLEEIVERIQLCNKSVAEQEVERRRLAGQGSMRELIEDSGEPELMESYRRIIKLLNEVKTQKETNDMLIKMGLGYSSKMLGILSPGSATSGSTYTNRGNYRK